MFDFEDINRTLPCKIFNFTVLEISNFSDIHGLISIALGGTICFYKLCHIFLHSFWYECYKC